MAYLYQAIRLYVNYFQPSFKLRDKENNGSKVRRLYGKPMTPCERLLNHPAVPVEVKEKLKLNSRSLDPLGLLHRIRDQQAALAALAHHEDNISGPGGESLKQFTKQLGKMWQQGEVRPTHRASLKQARYWRTRKDPFESVWADVLLWLQRTPEATAKELFECLQQEYPGCFPAGQLRTLQRRVRAWRHVIARELVYANCEAFMSPEVMAVGLDKTLICQ